MPLVTLGLNHLTAPVDLREQVSFAPETTTVALKALAAENGIEEALILSTCNRIELSCTVQAGAEQQPRDWLYRHHNVTPGKLDEFLYHYQDDAAVQHLFRVATGLDSMVLGEPQILGQVKQAWHVAREASTLGTPMDRLLEHTFAVAKRVRTDTRIGAHTVSVAFTAVRLAEQVFADLADACVLLIGAGDTIELAARHLAEKHVRAADRRQPFTGQRAGAGVPARRLRHPPCRFAATPRRGGHRAVLDSITDPDTGSRHGRRRHPPASSQADVPGRHRRPPRYRPRRWRNSMMCSFTASTTCVR